VSFELGLNIDGIFGASNEVGSEWRSDLGNILSFDYSTYRWQDLGWFDLLHRSNAKHGAAARGHSA
jgi:hypothetical protein